MWLPDLNQEGKLIGGSVRDFESAGARETVRKATMVKNYNFIVKKDTYGKTDQKKESKEGIGVILTPSVATASRVEEECSVDGIEQGVKCPIKKVTLQLLEAGSRRKNRGGTKAKMRQG